MSYDQRIEFKGRASAWKLTNFQTNSFRNGGKTANQAVPPQEHALQIPWKYGPQGICAGPWRMAYLRKRKWSAGSRANGSMFARSLGSRHQLFRHGRGLCGWPIRNHYGSGAETMQFRT